MDPSPQEVSIARRRVESSVCAFGGNMNRERSMKEVASNKEAKEDSGGEANTKMKKEEPDTMQSVTVTPSSVVSPDSSTCQSRARVKYEEALASRYYENESRLSWEFEESPPIETCDDPPAIKSQGSGSSSERKGETDEKRSESDEIEYCKSVGTNEDASGRPSTSSPTPKMRYRCKLCGQPKQNHRCPFQQSLARSIGIMVYPTVNAFTAAEPGTIAASLSEMNNFVDILRDSQSIGDDSPNRPTPERLRQRASTQVTPESMRSSKLSPSSFNTPGRVGSARHRRFGRGSGSSSRKRSYAQASGDENDLLFVEPMELKPEQFRVISSPNGREAKEAYSYPALPLPYAQRQRLSDNLFSLSNEVPKLTDECALVLREARGKNMWDLAVAELMTQVVVIIYCPEGDNRFEGLRQYLLTLGIAC